LCIEFLFSIKKNVYIGFLKLPDNEVRYVGVTKKERKKKDKVPNSFLDSSVEKWMFKWRKKSIG
jgi:hypothetical protein